VSKRVRRPYSHQYVGDTADGNDCLVALLRKKPKKRPASPTEAEAVAPLEEGATALLEEGAAAPPEEGAALPPKKRSKKRRSRPLIGQNQKLAASSSKEGEASPKKRRGRPPGAKNKKSLAGQLGLQQLFQAALPGLRQVFQEGGPALPEAEEKSGNQSEIAATGFRTGAPPDVLAEMQKYIVEQGGSTTLSKLCGRFHAKRDVVEKHFLVSRAEKARTPRPRWRSSANGGPDFQYTAAAHTTSKSGTGITLVTLRPEQQ